MAPNTMPEDDSNPNATRLRVADDANSGKLPPQRSAENPSDSMDPRGLQETIMQPAGATQVDSLATGSSSSESQIDLSNLTIDLKGQETGEFSVESSKATGTVAANDATGEFSVSGATANPHGTQRPTQRNTVRSGGSQGSESPLPETVGNYQIKKELGRGGMGVVYLARQAALNRDVALKMVLAGNHASKNQLTRFQAEARAVAQLQHPNIVQVFEVGEHQGLPYFSLEFVDGVSLDQLLGGKPLPPREAAKIAEKICRAMQYAHDRGILHRDIKPANILLTKDQQPKVTDFGLAKQLDDEDSLSTKAGTIMGTPSYMSPEQAQGLVDELSPASDQYSLGALLYELLTGRPPFLGTKAFDTISQVVHKEPVPPCQLQEKMPVDIDTICLKALQKTPDKRYANCDEMADDLGRFLRGEPIIARPVSKFERAWRWCKRNPLVAAPSALATMLLVATAVISTWSFLQISAQAVTIADERDNANTQRDEANKQRQEADKQRLVAVANEEKAQQEKEEAERQRILANEAKARAEANEKIAERQAMLSLQNIQFFITEVDERMAKQPGTAELRIGLLEVLEKKWDELDAELAGGIKGEAVPTLMAVRFKIADAWESLDRLEKASLQFDTIEKMGRQRLIDKDRSDASRVNLSRILLRMAPVRQRLTGDPAVGEKLVVEAEELLRDVLAVPRPQPGSPQIFEITDLLQQSLLRRANSSLKIGLLDKAANLFGEVQTLCQKVLDEINADAAWYQPLPDARKTLIKSYFQQSVDIGKTGQANILNRQGKTELAIPIYDQVLETRRNNYKAQPNDTNTRDQLALQLRNYGQNMLRVGRTDDAVRLIGEAHDLTEQNYNFDSKSATFKRTHSYSLYYWGVARAEAGQASNALALFERARALRQELFDTSPDQVNKVNLMLVEGRLGNREAAEKWIGELSKITAKDPDLRLDLARAQAQLSDQEADVEKKEILRTQAFASLTQAISDGLKDPFAIASEVDLKPLRGDPRFDALVEQLKAK